MLFSKTNLSRGLRRVNTVSVLRFRNSSCCRGRIARTRLGTRSRPTQANGSSNGNMSAAYERELNEVFLAASTPSWGSKLTSSSRSMTKRRDATRRVTFGAYSRFKLKLSRPEVLQVMQLQIAVAFIQCRKQFFPCC